MSTILLIFAIIRTLPTLISIVQSILALTKALPKDQSSAVHKEMLGVLKDCESEPHEKFARLSAILERLRASS